MNDRRDRIKDLFHRALELPAADRREFLSNACAGDMSICDEVESLVRAHSSADDFLEVPAYEMAAESFAREITEMSPGQRLGPYTVLSSLGFGGMGEVYLARDERLDRKVALKLLAWEFARDEKRVLRFEQEARAVSALNHPNVCVIHEIGRAENGRHFMAMEFIDGITLRLRMAQKQFILKEVVDIGAQIARALEAAHSAGIVHRDIKPENIMLRRDGYVKVLDFGIAKLTAPVPRQRGVLEADTVPQLQTAPGTLMGTTKYMSPEQLRELPVDHRSDIWSLGVVLHEMVTGFTPFEARTTNDTIAVILAKQPAPLGFVPDRVPEAFQRIVRKALSKKRSERYQTISELGSDLGKLRRQISADAPLQLFERSTLNLETTTGKRQGASAGAVGSTIFSRVKSQATWTAEYVLSEIKQHKTAAVFTGVTAVFALLFIGLGSPNFFSRAPLSSSSPQSKPAMELSLLTTSGKTAWAAISPDGNYVAYAEEQNMGKEKGQQLLLTGLATSGQSILVAPARVTYGGVTFSRDGQYVYFVRSNEDRGARALYEVAFPGGTPRKIKDKVDSPITVSPNGNDFAFVRVNESSGEFSLMTAALDGSSERVIAARKDGSEFSVYGPAWSPDGEKIVAGAASWDGGYHTDLLEIRLADGRETIIGDRSWFSIRQVSWLEDKSALIISAKEEPLSLFQLWRIPYPQGEPTRVTTEVAEYDTVSIAGNKVVAMRTVQNWEIWTMSAGDVQNARPIRSGIGRSYGLDWINDGRILFAAMEGNNQHIFRIDSDGSNQIQFTPNGSDNYSPAATPDGRYVVFSSRRNGRFNIWRMNAEDGSELRQLTFSDGNFYPSVSLDGRWVVYDNQTSPKINVWKVSIDGGEAMKLTDNASRMPVVSPDNQFIACRYLDSTWGVAILPFAGGEPVRRLNIPTQEWQRIQWTADGRALTYINVVDGVSNIWSYDLASGRKKPITNFKSDQIFAYGWSLDYKALAIERGSRSSYVALIRNP